MKLKKVLLSAVAVIAVCGVAVTSLKFESTEKYSKVNIETRAQGDSTKTNGLLFTELEDGTYEVSRDYTAEKPKGKLVIPASVNGTSVTRIADGAFSGCKDITEVLLPESITSVGANAFTDTAFLNNQTNVDVKYAGNAAVWVKTTAPNITIKDGTTVLADKLFVLCEDKLKTVSLPDTIKYLGNSTFSGCKNLQTVNIPNGVKEIGSGDFYGCTSLTNVTIPNSVTSVGNYAFAESGITTADLSSVTRIGKGAFKDSKQLKSAIPYTETSDDTSFDSTEEESSESDGSENATEVSVVTASDVSNRKYVEIGGLAFAGTPYYESLPEPVKYFGSVLIGCDSNAETVVCKDGTTAIADMAFVGCKNLKTVTIPESVKTIGEDAFFNCTALNSVTISDGVETIGEDAFRLCTALTSIEIPNSVTRINNGAFYGTGLKTITYKGTLSDWANIIVGDADALPVSAVVNLEDSYTISQVSDLKADSSTGNSVTLTWNKVNNATRYEIEVEKNGKWESAGRTLGDDSTFTVDDLEQRTTYKFRVTAYIHSLHGNAAECSGSTKLAPPKNIRTDADETSITLSWDKNPLADSYQVDLYKDGEWHRLEKTTGTSVTATGLTKQTEYKFKVFSFDGNTYSNSAVITAVTDAASKPHTVRELKAVPSANSITLSWDKLTYADSYQIDMLVDGKWKYVTKITDNSYTVTGLSANTTYNFRVFSFKGSAYSVPSAKITAKTTAGDSTKPATPANLKAAVTAESVTLSWNKVTNADSYQIDKLVDGKWKYVAKVTDDSYTVTGLSENTSYDFRVFSFKGSNYSPISAKITAKTASSDSAKPATAANPKATVTANSITLSWDKVNNADFYQIDKLVDGKWKYVTQTADNSYTVTGLSENTSYNFRIFTFKGKNYSASAKITAKTAAEVVEKPATVTNLKAESAVKSITLSWDKVSGADSYQIDKLVNGKWKYVAKITGNSYTVTDLAENTSYDFRVFTFKGKSYSSSAKITAKTTAGESDKPFPVTNLQAMPFSTSITLSWDKNNNADSYQIDKLENGKWKYVAKVTSNSYTVTGLSSNTSYNFRMFAFKGSSYSSSTKITAKTTASATSTKPSTVTGLKASAASTSVTLTWDKNPTADSYQIDKYNGNKWEFVAKVYDNSYTVTNLAPQFTYQFRVFAFNGSNYSSSARISTITQRMYALSDNISLADNFKTNTMLKGIDVSGWQGEIDFIKVKESGVDFVIIKAGEGTSTVESWETNYTKAKAAGLDVGAYWFTNAETLNDGKIEARAFIEALKGKQLEFPVFFDMEESRQFDRGKEFCTRLVESFCGELENANYYAGVYCSTNWFTGYVDDSVRVKRPAWIADYRGNCYFKGAAGMWQYGLGKISGIEGECDVNIGYIDYSRHIKTHSLNGF